MKTNDQQLALQNRRHLPGGADKLYYMLVESDTGSAAQQQQ